MTQEQKASPEQVSQETVSPAVNNTAPAVVSTAPVIPQPLTEERIQQLIAEATQKAIEQGKTLGKREMQGIKDKEVAEVKRKADLAEKRVKSYETSFTALDEETRATVEQHRTKAELESYRSREQEEEAKKQQAEYFERLNQSLRDEVTSLGIDPADKRIDYAEDGKDYFDGRKRFSDSLSKIIKSDREKLEKDLSLKAEEKFKQLEVEFRKKHGLDSHDTTASPGVVNQSDADFMAAWGAYNLPDTKENRTRYEEIKKKYY